MTWANENILGFRLLEIYLITNMWEVFHTALEADYFLRGQQRYNARDNGYSLAAMIFSIVPYSKWHAHGKMMRHYQHW